MCYYRDHYLFHITLSSTYDCKTTMIVIDVKQYQLNLLTIKVCIIMLSFLTPKLADCVGDGIYGIGHVHHRHRHCCCHRPRDTV